MLLLATNTTMLEHMHNVYLDIDHVRPTNVPTNLIAVPADEDMMVGGEHKRGRVDRFGHR